MVDRARACAEWEAALPLQALGALEGEEARNVTDHVRQCPACAQRVRDFEAAADSLAFAVPAATASAGVRIELLRRAAEPQPARRPASIWLRPLRVPAWAGAVAAALLVAVPAASAAAILNEHATAQRQGARLTALERQVASPLPDRSLAARVVSLPGSAAAPTAAGELAWYPSLGQVALAVHRLPPASAGRSYQAWLLRDKEWVSLGMLVTNAAGEGRLLVPLPATLAAYDAFWLSEEPVGGSAQPNGPKIIVKRFA